MSAVPEDPNNPTVAPEKRCDSCQRSLTIPCGANSSLSIRSHLIACGHVVCDRCRKENAAAVWCKPCERFVFPLRPELPPQSSRGGRKRAKQTTRVHLRCMQHNLLSDLQCPCGEKICPRCIRGSHATHFQYEELFEMEDRLDKEVQRLTELKNFLIGEKMEMSKKRSRIETNITDANKEIALKCTLIIAQAISRCLDLMAQTTTVGRTYHKDERERMASIQETIESIQKAMVIAEKCKSTAKVSFRMDQLKIALAMCSELGDQHAPINDPENGPVLNASFSAFDGIMREISNFGDVITTNLVDHTGECREVATIPTSLISNDELNGDTCRTAFVRFQSALAEQERTKKLKYSNPRFIWIAHAVAPIVRLPTVSEFMYIRMVSSTYDSLDRNPQYEVAVDAAAAAAAIDDSQNVGHLSTMGGDGEFNEQGAERRPLKEALPVSLKGWKPVRMDQKTSQRGRNNISDQPGPSSQKKIKVEEEEEEIDGSNHMKDLMSFAQDCEKAAKCEEELDDFMDDGVKVEEDEGEG